MFVYAMLSNVAFLFNQREEKGAMVTTLLLLFYQPMNVGPEMKNDFFCVYFSLAS